jgi:predicted extracellular nuclease
MLAAVRRSLTLLLLFALAGANVPRHAERPFPAEVLAAGGRPVISQLFADGGPDTPFPRDFVELFNPGPAAVPLAGWSVQYASAGGATWTVTPLSGVIPPGEHYLVQQGARLGSVDPQPNATGLTNMSATVGKVALVQGLTPLQCSSPDRCLTDPTVIDLVGYGPASAFEGSAPAPTPPDGLALRRALDGTDTDDNAADFTAQAPDPTANAISGPACTLTDPPIHQLQGAAHRSWHEGCTVLGVTGTVTAVRPGGFFLQEPMPDADEATAEGIFVEVDPLAGFPAALVGDQASVDEGRLIETRSGDTQLTSTRIDAAALTTTPGAGAVITPVVIGSDGRLPPSLTWDPANGSNVEASTVFDPTQTALDFYESLEGMVVDISDPLVVGPTTDAGELVVLAGGGAGVSPRSIHGGPLVVEGDFNPERIILDDGLLTGTARPPMPAARVGDRLGGRCCTGIMEYGSPGVYRVLLTEVPALIAGGLSLEATAGAGVGELAVATFNVENLDPGDGEAKFARLAEIIVHHLGSPDLIAVEEIQDRSGGANDRVTEATATLAMLTDAILEAGGPCYAFRQIDPLDNQDGGETGGNIRQGFLFRPDRGLAFVDRPGGDAITAVAVEPGPALSISPGRVDPRNPAFTALDPAPSSFSRSRKPLVGEFTINGEPLFVIANHFSSKGPDAPQFGRFQPPALVSEEQRIEQAQVVRLFVDALLDADPEARIIVLGDLNDFQFAPPVAMLTDGGGPDRDLTNAIERLPQPGHYTYVFVGNAQAIDHILISAALVPALSEVDIVHVNAEFPDAVSDHDPVVVRLALPGAGVPAATPVATVCG